MKNKLPGLFIILFFCSGFARIDAQTGLTGMDGNKYTTVDISGTLWMSENLNVSWYSNGDPIPQVQDRTKWSALKSGAWCYYEYKEGDHKIKGKLYNGHALLDKRGLAPKGWKIPVSEDWYRLDDWREDTTQGYPTYDTSRQRLFLRNDISTMDCFKNRSYYRTGKGEFGTMKCLGLWWLPENDDMTYQFSRCENRDGYWFGMEGLPADWKNYGFFVRCRKE